MECYRIDESGYTGFDLLNADQQFQGAAAIAISDEQAASLINKHFPAMQATELKYRSLSRRSSNKQRLLGLLRDILADYKCVTYVCDKRFLLLLMFLDYAVEPFYYRRDLDFYADGQNYALASLLYFTGSTLLGESAFKDMQFAFQSAVKEKTDDALKQLVNAVRKTEWQELPEALGPLARFEAPECLSAIATPGVTTDAALIVLQALISRMEVMSDGTYHVVHDQSKNLLTYNDILQRFINHDKDIEFRVSDIASIKFPLKLASVSMVDSKTSPAVQLADVLVGATIEAANALTGRRNKGLDPRDVLALFADEQLIHLLPSLDFAQQRKFRQGTQASKIIDYFSQFHA